jgi:hypothetical protein
MVVRNQRGTSVSSMEVDTSSAHSDSSYKPSAAESSPRIQAANISHAVNSPPLTTYLVENQIISDDDFETPPKFRTIAVGPLAEQKRIARQLRRRIVESSSTESDARLSPLRESSTTQARLNALADLPAATWPSDEEYEFDLSDLPNPPTLLSVTKITKSANAHTPGYFHATNVSKHVHSPVPLPASNVPKHAHSPSLPPASNVSKHAHSPVLLPINNVSKHVHSPVLPPDTSSLDDDMRTSTSNTSALKNKSKAPDGLTSKLGSFMSNLLPGNRSAFPKRAASPDSDKRSIVRIVARSESTAASNTEAQVFAALQQENMKLQESNKALLDQLAALNQSNDEQTQQIVKLNNELSGFRLTFDRLEQSLSDMTMKYATLISQLHPTITSQPEPNATPTIVNSKTLQTKTATDDGTAIQPTRTLTDIEDPMLLDNNHRNRTWVNPQIQPKPTKITSTADSQHAHAHPRPWNAAAMSKVQQSSTPAQAPAQTPAQVPPPQSYAQAISKTTPSARPRKSYAAIAQKLTANKDEGNIQAAQSALGFLHQRRLPSKSTAEQRMGLRRIYVNGIPRTSYKTLKTHLYSLRFMLSKIANISYIAQNCVEFLVHEDYASSFLAKCRFCQLEVIQADPTKPLDPNYPSEKLPEVKILFQKRLEGILKNSNNDIVKDFFTQYAAEHNVTLSIPTTTPEEEMEL